MPPESTIAQRCTRPGPNRVRKKKAAPDARNGQLRGNVAAHLRARQGDPALRLPALKPVKR